MTTLLWCCLSNENSSAILSNGTIDFSEVVFTKRYMEILLSFTLAIFGSELKVKAPYSETLNAGMTLEHRSMFSTHSAISH